jgi:hypothetical protein
MVCFFDRGGIITWQVLTSRNRLITVVTLVRMKVEAE